MDPIFKDAARTRMDAFVDAAFAFAVTLLIVAGAQPLASMSGLWEALANIPAAFAAFCLISLFWLAHRAFGRICTEREGPSLMISLAIVFTVLVYVFPLRLMMQSGFYWASGGRLPGDGLIRSFADLTALYQIYGVGFALLSALYLLLFLRALKLAPNPEIRDEALSNADAWAVCMAMGLVSAALAAVPLGKVSWIPPLAYSAIPILILTTSLMRRRAAKGG